jgi:hypothetical protein
LVSLQLNEKMSSPTKLKAGLLRLTCKLVGLKRCQPKSIVAKGSRCCSAAAATISLLKSIGSLIELVSPCKMNNNKEKKMDKN